jgi:hypothetical protein
MAEERSTNVTLNSKGMEAFVSDPLATHLFERPGERRLLLIEVHTNKRVLNENGTRRVHLSVDSAEVIPEEHETRFRDVMRALYLNRPDDFGQGRVPIEGELAQDPDDALAAAAAPIEEEMPVGPGNEGGEDQPEGWDGDTEPKDPKGDEKVLAFSSGRKK